MKLNKEDGICLLELFEIPTVERLKKEKLLSGEYDIQKRNERSSFT
ncbi:MAG: hypothetical protein ACLU8F_02865 [Clostridia bacterium]